MTQKTTNEIINKWLVDTVIGLNLCPFAKVPYESGQIKIETSKAQSFEEAFADFIKEIELITTSEIVTTTLLAYESLTTNFLEFNDFIGSLEETLEDNDLAEAFQLVCFHPGFYFDELEQDDLANYVNRSPVPVIHILRKIDVTNAMSSIEAGESISLINEQTIKSLTIEQLKKYFWYLY